MSVTAHIGKIQTQLCWINSALLLVSEPDKKTALLDCHQQLAERRQHVEDALASILDLAAQGLADSDLVKSVEADYAKWLEISSQIIIAVGNDAPLPGPTEIPNLDFSGDLENWLSYRDLYESVINKHHNWSLTQKLVYLYSTLRGEPRLLIQHLEVKDVNYTIAWSLLCHRYHNISKLADFHMGRIFNLPRATEAKIRMKILNPLISSLEALKLLDLSVGQWSYLLVHVVLSKLPQRIRDRFEDWLGGNNTTDFPEFGHLLTFLEEEALKAEKMSDTCPTKSCKQRRCSFCKKPGHQVSSCSEFKQMPVSMRRSIAQVRQWCFSCLGGHFQRKCPYFILCSKCKGTHHQILCAAGFRSWIKKAKRKKSQFVKR